MEIQNHVKTSPTVAVASVAAKEQRCRTETTTGSPLEHQHHFNEAISHPQRGRFGSDPKKKPRVLPLNIAALHLHKEKMEDDSDDEDSARFKGVLYSPSSSSSARDTDSPRPFSSVRPRSPMSPSDLTSISPTITSSRSPPGEGRIPLVTMLRSANSRESTQSSHTSSSSTT